MIAVRILDKRKERTGANLAKQHASHGVTKHTFRHRLVLWSNAMSRFGRSGGVKVFIAGSKPDWKAMATR